MLSREGGRERVLMTETEVVVNVSEVGSKCRPTLVEPLATTVSSYLLLTTVAYVSAQLCAQAWRKRSL